MQRGINQQLGEFLLLFSLLSVARDTIDAFLSLLSSLSRDIATSFWLFAHGKKFLESRGHSFRNFYPHVDFSRILWEGECAHTGACMAYQRWLEQCWDREGWKLSNPISYGICIFLQRWHQNLTSCVPMAWQNRSHFLSLTQITYWGRINSWFSHSVPSSRSEAVLGSSTTTHRELLPRP